MVVGCVCGSGLGSWGWAILGGVLVIRVVGGVDVVDRGAICSADAWLAR